MAKRHYSEPYAGDGARRTQEMQDAGMIREDRSAIANLPQSVMIKMYPQSDRPMPESLDDTITGIDHQISTLDDGKRNSHMAPKKV